MHAELNSGRITIYDSFPYRERIKQIEGRFWHTDRKVWTIPFTENNVLALETLGCNFGKELCQKVNLMINNIPALPRVAVPLETMPIKSVPYIHQIEAFNRACASLGIFKGGALYG